MKMRVLLAFLGIAGLVLLVGCGGDPPMAELNAAKQALDDARATGAEKFASSEYSAAKGAYDQAESVVNTEKEKLFKNFDPAKQLIAEAQRKAETAKSATVTAKDRAKSGAEVVIADAAATIQKARTSLESAPSGKGTEGDIEQLQADLNAADADLSTARSAVASEDFDQANSMAASAKQKAEVVENGVQAAVERYNELVEKNRPWYERI